MAEIFALPAIIEKEIRALIKYGYYASIDEAVKDAFRTLLNAKPDLRTVAAVELYKEGGVSLDKAAEIAGVTTIEFKDILADRGIRREVGSRSVEELEKGVELIKRLRR
jgi:predicted HTH domain antitoxin